MLDSSTWWFEIHQTRSWEFKEGDSHVHLALGMEKETKSEKSRAWEERQSTWPLYPKDRRGDLA